MTSYCDNTHLTTFRNYIALKLHFNEQSSYNYSENSLQRVPVDTMLKRKDLRFFAGLTDLYNGNSADIYEHLVTCFTLNPNMWIGDMVSKKYQKNTIARLDTLNNLHYHVTSLFDGIDAFTDNPSSMFTSNGDRPQVIKMYSTTPNEVFACIDTVNNFTLSDTCNPLWYTRKGVIRSYSKLLDFEERTVLYCKTKLSSVCSS